MKPPVVLLGCFTVLSMVEGKTPKFRTDAGSFMEAGFRTVRRRGGLQSDFTKIEVAARPLSMVESPLDIDTNRVSIEIKTGRSDIVQYERHPVQPEINPN